MGNIRGHYRLACGLSCVEGACNPGSSVVGASWVTIHTHHVRVHPTSCLSRAELSGLTQPTHIYPSLTLTQWSDSRRMRAVIPSCFPLSPWILPAPSLTASCQSVTADYPWDIFADLYCIEQSLSGLLFRGFVHILLSQQIRPEGLLPFYLHYPSGLPTLP